MGARRLPINNMIGSCFALRDIKPEQGKQSTLFSLLDRRRAREMEIIARRSSAPLLLLSLAFLYSLLLQRPVFAARKAFS